MRNTQRHLTRWLPLPLVIMCAAIMGATAIRKQRTYEGFTEPVREIKVAASESSRVAEVLVRRGAVVKKDDILMNLDTKILEASLRIAQAKAESTSRVEALRIEAEIKSNRFARIDHLNQNGAGSPEEVRRAKADSAVAQLNVQSAIEDQSLNELAVAEIEAKIEQRRVRSPINGIVIDVLQEPGEYVSLNEPQVATVVQLEDLRVTFYIPTDLATQLKEGQEIMLELPGLDPPSTSVKTTGTIEHLAVVTEADSGRVRMDVLIANPKLVYRSGVRCWFTPQ